MPDKQRPALAKQIEREVTDYLTKDVKLGDGVSYSQHKLVRRVFLFETKTYPTGKFDSQGNYKFWFDMITPRIDAEVKNIDFDTKNVEVYSPRKVDELPNLIINLKLTEWLRENGQAEEINSAIEEGAGWGNVVWKKVRGAYERVDLRNFFVINQTAKTLNESAEIERHSLTQSDLREAGARGWKHVNEVINSCGQNLYKADVDAVGEESTTPKYLIFERNGEVCLKDLKEFQGEEVTEGDEKIYVLAKVIAAGVEGSSSSVSIKYIMFAEKISKRPYKEYHRGRYKGRWMREGLYELLFDVQVRGNEIGNQLARGLEWASKIIFTDDDKLAIQSIATDLKNGDFIRSKNLRQVEVRMQGLDQLIAEWNRLVQIANDIANSREIVQGDSLPSGTPFKMGNLLNVNANKLFDFIREKLSIPIREIFEEWIVPELIKDIKAEDVIRLTGDSDMLARLYELIVEDWYVRNLVAIGPHSPEMAQSIKAQKLEELKRQTLFMKEFKKKFEAYKPNVAVVITGENIDLVEKLQTLGTFISLEMDPVRRSYLVERAMRLKGIDAGSLPRSTPDQLAGVKPQTAPAPGKEPLAEPV